MNSNIIDLEKLSVAAAPDPVAVPHISPAYRVAKRALDICGALLGLALLGLLLPLIALLIALEDRGPVFYRQRRIGQYGRFFTTYKLRSMHVDADERLRGQPELYAAWLRQGKLRDDPRITRTGRLLRRTSLDELPQMWNVLRGEMSLVGPRAIQASEVAAFGEHFALRQLARPGLTGLWQVSGRSTTGYAERCTLDCLYVLQRSFWLDVRIILKTIPVVIRGIGAY